MKQFFYRIRIPLIEWYFVAAACYFCIQGMNMEPIIFPMIIGFVLTYLTEPIVIALSDDHEVAQKEFLSEKPKTWKNVLKAYFLFAIILGIYYLVNLYLFPTAVEPFSFGVLFWVLDKCLGLITRKLKKQVSPEGK